MLKFLTESSQGFEVTESIGGFNSARTKNSFDDVFTEAYNDMLVGDIDVMSDINNFIRKPAIVADLKDRLLNGIVHECTAMREAAANDDSVEYGTHAMFDEQLSAMFDNAVNDLVREATTVGNLLPIKAIDFPVLIKQHLKLASKDVLQTEIVKSPIVKKHIEQTYIIDPKSGKEWKYPQAFFTDDFEEIFTAGKGLPIKEDPVELPIYEFSIAKELTDAEHPDKEEFTYDLQINTVMVNTDKVKLPRPMRIKLSDGQWLNGKLKGTYTTTSGSQIELDDIILGTVDFAHQTVTITSAKKQVTHVIFNGYLSNKRNERAVTFDYRREEIEWKIEDGMRAQASYALEDLEDHKALMDIDLYQKTYNNLSDFMVQMEDNKNFKWLDEMYDKYDGVEVPEEEILSWGSFVTEKAFDFDSTSLTTALPSEFIEKMLKFTIDGLIVDLADRAKTEDWTFVLYGNPRLIRFLNPVINWVTRPGMTSNGVKLDYGYGIMTSGDVKVQVVSTKKVNVAYDDTDLVYKSIRIIPYPMSDEQFTFKHFKYTSHILTNQNSAYRDADRPGGSYNYIVGTSRYTNACVQGIQAKVDLLNAEPYISKK